MGRSISTALSAVLLVSGVIGETAWAAEWSKQLVMAVTPSNILTELFKASEVFAAELGKRAGSASISRPTYA